MLKSLFTALDISASGLNSQRTRMNVISENIANAETTRTADGTPYRRKLTVLESGQPGKKFSEIITNPKLKFKRTNPNHRPEQPFKEIELNPKYGVHVDSIVKDMSPFRMEYDPNHPDANENGYVAKPNVNIIAEMTELVSATRSFEANVTAFNSSKDMLRKAIRL